MSVSVPLLKCDVVFQNRIALLRKEEQRAWRKIQQTKKRAGFFCQFCFKCEGLPSHLIYLDEIILMRRESERRLEEQQELAIQVRLTGFFESVQ